jgi:hypothetical protein
MLPVLIECCYFYDSVQKLSEHTALHSRACVQTGTVNAIVTHEQQQQLLLQQLLQTHSVK